MIPFFNFPRWQGGNPSPSQNNLGVTCAQRPGEAGLEVIKTAEANGPCGPYELFNITKEMEGILKASE